MDGVISVARLLRPRSVAIVGASPDPGTIGNNVLANLRRTGFTGDIHLVSRNRAEIDGVPCVRTIDDLPKGIDAVVLIVPEAVVADGVEACVRREAGAAVVFASGFAEMGGDGTANQKRITDAARAGGLALLGPNCIGLTNFADGVALTFEPATDAATRVPKGAMVLAQSGAMTSNLRLALRAKNIPVAAAISTGNEAVTGVEDFLADALERDGMSMAVLFIEQVRRPQTFLALARRAKEKRVPVLMLHPGRTERARAAALTHTGALAGDYATMACALAAENVLLVDTLDELFDATAMLSRWPSPSPLGVGVVTNSGAFRGIALDLAAERGMTIPALAPKTADALKAMLPAYAAIDNPLDITTVGLAQHDIFGRTAQAMLDDPALGALLCAYIPGSPQLQMIRIRSLEPVIAATDKPVALSLFGDETPLSPEFIAAVRDAKLPLFRSPDRALRAVALLQRYGHYLARKPDAAPLASLLPLPGKGAVPEHRAKAWLKTLGIATSEGALATTRDEAHAIAGRLGYPVVLKAQAADLPHKSDVGGVIVGVGDDAALGAAWARLHANLTRARPGLTLDGVLVERQAAPGLELIVGARRDPDWGPVVMVGLGGVWAEALHDVRLVPCGREAADYAAAFRALKGAALLDTHRGAPARDVAAAANVAMLLGQAMLASPALAEIEINPLVLYENGALALDALMAVA